MNKQRKTIITLTLILIITLSTLPLTAQAKKTKKEKSSSIHVKQITKNIMRFEETIPLDFPSDPPLPEGAYYKVNVYGIKLKTGVVLIDAGDENLAKELYQTVTRKFHKPIIAVYLTHGHADHAGGGSYFQEQDVPVYVGAYDVPILTSGSGFEDPMIPEEFTYEPYTPDNQYEGFDLLPGFSITPTPGHTMGSVSITYTSGHKSYLFTGDTIMEMPGTDPLDQSYIISLYNALNVWQMDQNPLYPEFIYLWKYSLDTLASITPSVKIVCPGHGAPYKSKHASDYIEATWVILDDLPTLPSL